MSGYLLWGKVTWLSIVVIILTLSYSVHLGEQQEFNINGSYDKTTATRLGLTFALVAIIFTYSLFIKINSKNNLSVQKPSVSQNSNYTNNDIPQKYDFTQIQKETDSNFPLTSQTLSYFDLFKKDCDNLPNIPFFKDGVIPTATIDNYSLISESEFPTIFGTYSNVRTVLIVVWKDKILLSPILSDTLVEAYYSAFSDHGGTLASCPVGSKFGRYFNKSWKSFPNGTYTVGIYDQGQSIYNNGFQGNEPSKLLTSGTLNVIIKK